MEHGALWDFEHEKVCETAWDRDHEAVCNTVVTESM